MNVNLHAIGNNDFSISIKGTPDKPLLVIQVGDAEVNIFLHDGKGEKALADIDTAIRSFVIEGDNL
jgi:hypothetical protein